MASAPEPSSSTLWKEQPGNCPVCGTPRYSDLGRRGGDAHRSGLGTPAHVVRCRECHLVYCHPALRPIGNPYAAYEGDEYFVGHNSDAKLQNGRLLAAKAEELLGRKGRLLELGCGRGELLAAAAQQGWSVQGVEMTPQFAQAAASRGIHVECCAVESSTLLDMEGAFDAIYLAAILEHLYDPIQCLRRVRDALAPDGVVFIDVPNECSLRTKLGNAYMRLRGRDWAVNLSPTFPPFHVVGFCPTSLRRALREAGIEPLELQVVTWLDLLQSRPGVWSHLEVQGAKAVNRVSAMIGDGDGIVCWGRKSRLA